jgi:hypothetical protein
MNLSGFTDRQKERLLDLLILGMYADAHLARSEEARIQKLLDALQFPSPDARNQFADAGIARARAIVNSPESVSGAISEMAKEFAMPDVRKKAAEALELLLFSDSKMIEREREFLASVRNAFGC